MFLFLSGYGLSKSYDKSGLESYWWKKLLRIGIPWLLWCCMFFIISRVTNLIESHNFIIRYWYLEYTFVWYFLFWACKLFLSNHRISLIILGVSSVAMFFIWPTLQAEQSVSFFSGVLLAEMERKEGRVKFKIISQSRWKVVLPLALLIYATFFLVLKQMPQVREFGGSSILMKLVQINIKFPYAMAMILLMIVNKIPAWIYKTFCPIGVLSLELYLVHMLFYSYVSGSFGKLLILLIVTAILTLLLHELSDKFVARLRLIKPLDDFLKTIKSIVH